MIRERKPTIPKRSSRESAHWTDPVGSTAVRQADKTPVCRRKLEVTFDEPPASFTVGPPRNEAAAPDRASTRAEASSPLTLYMRDAGEVPLLTRLEEIQLARRIRRGDATARERMIRANLRFVIKIAREYEHLGLPLLDLINEGNIGLMRAVDRFDPRKGAKLSTYSVWWIRQNIRRALSSQVKTIRLPVYAVEQVYHLGRAELGLRHRLGRDATEFELAVELGLTAERIGQLRLAALHPVSLDVPLGDDSSSRLAEVIADDNAEIPGQRLDGQASVELLRAFLPKLPAREATILRLRFGLDGVAEKTLEEIGALMRLTRERIRQLQNTALAKLRRLIEDREAISVSA